MTKRAKRLAKYLDELGWNVFDTTTECKGCGKLCYTKYCPDCGTKQPEQKNADTQVVCQLEKAIAYALDDGKPREAA
jgi:RNA polymerase subunit RPABC4/transcription elongation factor Spt4